MPLPIDERTLKILAKRQHKKLANILSSEHLPGLMALQATLVQAAGHKDWHAAEAWWANPDPGPVTPAYEDSGSPRTARSPHQNQDATVAPLQPQSALPILDVVEAVAKDLTAAFDLTRRLGGIHPHAYLDLFRAFCALAPHVAGGPPGLRRGQFPLMSPLAHPMAFLERLLGARVGEYEKALETLVASVQAGEAPDATPLLALVQRAPLLRDVLNRGGRAHTYRGDADIQPPVHRDAMMAMLNEPSALSALVVQLGDQIYEPYYDTGTLLHRAGLYGSPRALEMLHRAGLNLNHRNHDGCTVMDIALFSQHDVFFNSERVETLWRLGYRPTLSLQHRALSSLSAIRMWAADSRPPRSWPADERKVAIAEAHKNFQKSISVVRFLIDRGMDLHEKIFVSPNAVFGFPGGVVSVRDVIDAMSAQEKPSLKANPACPSFTALKTFLAQLAPPPLPTENSPIHTPDVLHQPVQRCLLEKLDRLRAGFSPPTEIIHVTKSPGEGFSTALLSLVERGSSPSQPGHTTVIRLQEPPVTDHDEDAFLRQVMQGWHERPAGAAMVVFIDTNVFETSRRFRHLLMDLAVQGIPLVCATTLLPGEVSSWPKQNSDDDVLNLRLNDKMVHFNHGALYGPARVAAKRVQKESVTPEPSCEKSVRSVRKPM